MQTSTAHILLKKKYNNSFLTHHEKSFGTKAIWQQMTKRNWKWTIRKRCSRGLRRHTYHSILILFWKTKSIIQIHKILIFWNSNENNINHQHQHHALNVISTRSTVKQIPFQAITWTRGSKVAEAWWLLIQLRMVSDRSDWWLRIDGCSIYLDCFFFLEVLKGSPMMPKSYWPNFLPKLYFRVLLMFLLLLVMTICID